MAEHPSIEERHAALAESVQLLFHAQMKTEEAVRRSEEANQEAQRKNEEAHRRFEEEHRRTEATLRRAIRLSVQEHRAERVRRKEANAKHDDQMEKLTVMQIETRQLLQEFIKWTLAQKNPGPA